LLTQSKKQKERKAFSRPRSVQTIRRPRPARTFRAITETVLIFAILFFILGLLGVRTAFGTEGGGGGNLSPFEASRIFPKATGILYPGLLTAGGVNPAVLVTNRKMTAIQAAYTPSLKIGYFTMPKTFSHTIGLSLGLTSAVSALVQYTTDRTLTGALTFFL